MKALIGYSFILIVLGLVGLQIACHRWIKKITNSYFFWLGISIALLTWLCVFRFVPDWIRYANTVITDPSDMEQSNIISKAFFLDVCPFVSLVIPICLIVDPTRKAARSLCPISLLGAFFVIFVQMPTGTFEFTWEYIFTGYELYCFMHVTNLLLAIGVLLNTPRHGWKGTLATYGATLAMFVYIIIVAYSTGAKWHVSGVTLNDFIPDIGEYGAVTKIFNVPYQLMPLIFYPLGGLSFVLPIHLNDYVFKKTKTWYINPQYSNYWYEWYKI